MGADLERCLRLLHLFQLTLSLLLASLDTCNGTFNILTEFIGRVLHLLLYLTEILQLLLKNLVMLCHHSVVRMKRPIGVETWGSVPNQIGRSARAQRHRLVVNVR